MGICMQFTVSVATLWLAVIEKWLTVLVVEPSIRKYCDFIEWSEVADCLSG